MTVVRGIAARRERYGGGEPRAAQLLRSGAVRDSANLEGRRGIPLAYPGQARTQWWRNPKGSCRSRNGRHRRCRGRYRARRTACRHAARRCLRQRKNHETRRGCLRSPASGWPCARRACLPPWLPRHQCPGPQLAILDGHRFSAGDPTQQAPPFRRRPVALVRTRAACGDRAGSLAVVPRRERHVLLLRIELAPCAPPVAPRRTTPPGLPPILQMRDDASCL